MLVELETLSKDVKKGEKSKKSPKEWKKTMNGLKKTIVALKKKVPSDDSSGNESNANKPTSNARNSFGGRAKKATKNRKTIDDI